MKKIFEIKKIKIIIIFLTFLTVFSISPQQPKSFVPYPFGGPIVGAVIACPLSNSLYVAIGPPSPITLSYAWGASFSFAFGPPIHPGQMLLGVASTAPYPCIIPCGPVPCILPTAGLIMFHGSSL